MTSIPLFDLPIEHAVFVRAEPERIYDAFTTAPGLDGWFTEGSEVQPWPGGQMIWRWKAWGPDRVTDTDGGPVLEARRPERFVFQWGEKRGKLTTIAVDFERVEGGTVVRLRHTGYEDTPAERAHMLNCATGWGEALTLLKFYVEHGLRY
ncbi:MAG: SRPBCC domain-containing protein [Anaerolineae bacterium]|nr:SRPBCC domain-containing protein [Anaerolineae bacterium]